MGPSSFLSTRSQTRAFENIAEYREGNSITPASVVASSDMSKKCIKTVEKRARSASSDCDFVGNAVSQLSFPMAFPGSWNVCVQGALRTTFRSRNPSNATMRSHCGWHEVEITKTRDLASPYTASQRDPLSAANLSSDINISNTGYEVLDHNNQSTTINFPGEHKINVLPDDLKPTFKEHSSTQNVSKVSPALKDLSRHHDQSSNGKVVSDLLLRNISTLSNFPGKGNSQVMAVTVQPNATASQIRSLKEDISSKAPIDKSDVPETMPQIDTESTALTKQEAYVAVNGGNKQKRQRWKERLPVDSCLFENIGFPVYGQPIALSLENDRPEPIISHELKDLSHADGRHPSSAGSSIVSIDHGRFDVPVWERQSAKMIVNNISTYSRRCIGEEPESSTPDAESFLQKKYFPPYNNTSQVHCCLSCASRNHRTWNCSVLSCMLCGDAANHPSSSCPLRQRCGKCRELGHLACDCPEKLGRARGESVPCDLCGSMYHVESGCHQIWRSSLPRPEEIQTIYKLPIHCYSCGASGRFGPECGLHTGPLLSGPGTWSKENHLKYVHPSSQHRALSIMHDDTGYGRPPRSFNIRDKASDFCDIATSQISQNAFRAALQQEGGLNLRDSRRTPPRKLQRRIKSNHITPPNYETSSTYPPFFQYPAPISHIINQVRQTNLATHQHMVARFGNQQREHNRVHSALPRVEEASIPSNSNGPSTEGHSTEGVERNRGRGGVSRHGGSRRGKSKRLGRPA